LSPPRPALVIFDLAGTTIRDRGEVPAAFADALAAAGLAVDEGAITRWRGASKREAVRHLVARAMPERPPAGRDALGDAIYRDFCATLMSRLGATPDLAFPEAQPSFERLQEAGIRVALNSGFDRAMVDAIVAATGWPPDLFDAVVSGDDVDAGRPEPDMIFSCMECTGVTDASRVAVVGDTRLDLEAAANAGAAWRIGVLSGAHDRATLSQAPYTHLVGSVGDVPGLWI
jgi:phosphonatase-like hydrolase